MSDFPDRKGTGRQVKCRLFTCRSMTWRNDAFCSDEHAAEFRHLCARSPRVRADGGGGLPSTTPALSREERRQLTRDAVERLLALHES